jgi:hypothetical protein
MKGSKIMNALKEPLTFTVPLSFEAHGLADRFRLQQSGSQKAKQVYLNTLAVYAVDFYLQCLGIETEANNSDSRNPVCLKFMDVADLPVKAIGRLECRPVLHDSTVMQVPIEVREDRVGYVAVQFERSLKQATILGFTSNVVAELPLSQLKSLEEFPEFLSQLRQPAKIRVNLRQWLNDYIEAGWQKLETLFSPEELILEDAMRSSLIERGKQICLATQVTKQTIVLIVRLNSQSENDTNIIVEVRPQSGQLYLPDTLQVTILDQHQTAVMQATASSTNKNILFDFNAEPKERFGVQMILGETTVTENFDI